MKQINPNVFYHQVYLSDEIYGHVWKNTRNVVSLRMESVPDAVHEFLNNEMLMNKIAEIIKMNLTDDLLKPGYKIGAHCYVASEVYCYYARGDVKPMNMRHEGESHWFVLDNGQVVDLTADQFKSAPDYSKARGRGFLTKQPSKRAWILIDRVAQQASKHLSRSDDESNYSQTD